METHEQISPYRRLVVTFRLATLLRDRFTAPRWEVTHAFPNLVGREGFEPTNSERADLQSAGFDHLPIYPKLLLRYAFYILSQPKHRDDGFRRTHDKHNALACHPVIHTGEVTLDESRVCRTSCCENAFELRANLASGSFVLHWEIQPRKAFFPALSCVGRDDHCLRVKR